MSKGQRSAGKNNRDKSYIRVLTTKKHLKNFQMASSIIKQVSNSYLFLTFIPLLQEINIFKKWVVRNIVLKLKRRLLKN